VISLRTSWHISLSINQTSSSSSSSLNLCGDLDARNPPCMSVSSPNSIIHYCYTDTRQQYASITIIDIITASFVSRRKHTKGSVLIPQAAWRLKQVAGILRGGTQEVFVVVVASAAAAIWGHFSLLKNNARHVIVVWLAWKQSCSHERVRPIVATLWATGVNRWLSHSLHWGALKNFIQSHGEQWIFLWLSVDFCPFYALYLLLSHAQIWYKW
jgi:hypothetical protein